MCCRCEVHACEWQTNSRQQDVFVFPRHWNDLCVSAFCNYSPRKEKKKGIKHTLRSNAFTFLLMKFNDGRSDTLTASNGGCFVPEEFIFQAVFLHHFCCGVKVWAATLPAVYNPRLQASFMDTFVLCWHIEFTPLISYMFHLIHLFYFIYLSQQLIRQFYTYLQKLTLGGAAIWTWFLHHSPAVFILKTYL